ncbi:MAG: ABC transporter permease [Planctomycetota bacterium]
MVIWAIARRELLAQFTTPLAWLVLAAWTFVTNLAFVVALPGEDAYSTLPLYMESLRTGHMVLLLLAPALTMNSFASEHQQGTMQLLLTVPVSELQLIAGKYLAAVLLFLVLIAATLVQPTVLYFVSDLGGMHLLSGYLGLVMLCLFLAALGIWISLLALNPVAAYVITFGLLLGLALLGLLADDSAGGATGLFASLGRGFGLGPRFAGFVRGMPRLADIAWFLAMTLGCLVLAHGSLRARRTHG